MLIITRTPCGGKGELLAASEKPGALGDSRRWALGDEFMGAFGFSQAERAIGPEVPTLLSPDRTLWHPIVSESRGCLLRSVSW